MRITAAVVAARGAPFRLRPVELAEPARDEVLVRVAASGLCQTDVHGRDAYYGTPFPCVFGHEGAGVVERVGADVRNVAPGDRVVMFAPSCGTCPACASRHPASCEHGFRMKMSGLLRNGRAPFADEAGTPIHGAFFQQSSFATHAVATARNVVRIDDATVPFELLAALPCGMNTGAGAVVHVLQPRAGDTIAIFGCGTVGLAGLLAAKRLGCSRIVAVDLHAGRLELARALGATDVVDAGRENVVERLRAITGGAGVHHSLEAAGDPRALRAAVDGLRGGGVACLVGSARPGVEASIEMTVLQHGRTVKGCIQGDSVPAEFIPAMVGWYREGTFPIDRLVTTYPFAEIERAVEDAVAGRTVKAVLKIGDA